MVQNLIAQEIINLPISDPGEVQWEGDEKEYFSNIWFTKVVTNVSKPTLSIYSPEKGTSNGTAVVICPGGGLYAHSIDSEGIDVAKALNKIGVTAAVLKYRLVPSGEDGVADIMKEDGAIVMQKVAKVLPLSTNDAIESIAYLRNNADRLGLNKDKIGLIGFSAGGAVTMNTTYMSDRDNGPNFVGPIYAWMNVVPESAPPSYAPPMFAVCASDDPLLLAPASVKLYSDWLSKGYKAELHMYSAGGHGFGMKVQNLPSDNWIDRFGEWMKVQGYLDKMK